MINIEKFNNAGAKTSIRKAKIQWIVIHYTAGVSSVKGKALANANMFKSSNRQASADFIVDDETIVQYNNDISGRYTWAVGDPINKYPNTSLSGIYHNQCNNSNSISIEMCSSKINAYSMSVYDDDWYITDSVINNTRDLVKYLMQQYNIDIDHVIMHHHVTGKWCPQPWVKNEQSLKLWDAFKESLITPTIKPLIANGIYVLSNDNNGVTAGLVTNKDELHNKDIEYRWVACEDDGTPDWFEISPWTKNNEWLNWKPGKYGNYVIVGYARIVGEETTTESAVGVKYHPYIKGICQQPKDDGTTLIGIESYDNQNYQYEISILDCTLLAKGEDAWIYSTQKCFSNTNAIWASANIDYGYYWTLFAMYDKYGNKIDEQCYGFANV